jgi:hypothetical protein
MARYSTGVARLMTVELLLEYRWRLEGSATLLTVKVKESRYRPGVAQRVPGKGSQIS